MELLKNQWRGKAELNRQGILVWNECSKTQSVEAMQNIL